MLWWQTLLLILALALLSGVFSLAETALLALRPTRVEQMLDEKRRGASAVKHFVANLSLFSATVQVGQILVNFSVAVLAAVLLAKPLSAQKWLPPEAAIPLMTIAIALLVMIVGEIAPRSLAMQAPDVWALRLAPFVRFCAALFAPFRTLALLGANVLVRPLGVRAQFATPMVTREEFEHLLEEGGKHGEIDDDEEKIIKNVFDLSETLVRSVMTPRTDMTALPASATLTEILDKIVASGHSRLPVYEENLDTILGMVHVKDLLPRLRDGIRDVELKRVVRPAFFVPETRKVSELLEEMRKSKHQIAIVQDEYAGTAGIVSIEDLLEEIVGDIQDEYDVDEPTLQVLSATESLVDGRMSLDDVNDRLGTSLEHEDYDTVGGLVFGILGHEPLPGERVQQDGVEFVVEEMEGRRVKTLRALRLPAEEA